jgi:hypothetical protein
MVLFQRRVIIPNPKAQQLEEYAKKSQETTERYTLYTYNCARHNLKKLKYICIWFVQIFWSMFISKRTVIILFSLMKTEWAPATVQPEP